MWQTHVKSNQDATEEKEVESSKKKRRSKSTGITGDSKRCKYSSKLYYKRND
jgi:hypothetical protein